MGSRGPAKYVPGVGADVLVPGEHEVGEGVPDEGGHLQHAPGQPGVAGDRAVVTVQRQEVALRVKCSTHVLFRMVDLHS